MYIIISMFVQCRHIHNRPTEEAREGVRCSSFRPKTEDRSMSILCVKFVLVHFSTTIGEYCHPP